MEADIKWLDNPEIFRVNQRKAHSDHICYASKEEADSKKNSLCQLLNGEWKFKYSKNAKERPVDFFQENFDASGFGSIKVPQHIELAGFDQIHYINTMYPWEGHEFKRPAYTISSENKGLGVFSESEHNPVGSYLTDFQLEQGLKGKNVSIRFEGAEQVLYVWLNGHFVGYAEDTFTPSEFDLTPYLKEYNKLAVEVHKWSTASYLEDQDFFRFFGIFRDVVLVARGDNHLEDLWIKPKLLNDNMTGTFDLNLSFENCTKGSKVMTKIYDPKGEIIDKDELQIKDAITFNTKTFNNVKIWDNHYPNLYKLELTVINQKGECAEYITYPFGFRRIEIKDRIIMLNGERHIINGTNRHEWNAKKGRAITMEDQLLDIEIMKKNHINSVRTSHYPSQISWYSLCDEHGIYVMAETNLETHGTWQKMSEVEPSYNVPGDVKEWKEVVLDRARTNFETFKNHVSILFWSLGNESYAGENIKCMNQYLKDKDDSRLTHYEGNAANPDYENSISDVKSRMYARPDEIRDYLDHDPKKPFILCEYMHDMGNSLGGMNTYMELLEEYPMYQGGYIWDFIDQALMVKDEVTGKEVLRYGGDFDDRPSDYEFSGNGIVFADRQEKPAMQEVRYYYGKYK